MFKKLIILILIAVFIILLRSSEYSDMATFSYLKTHADGLKTYVHQHYVTSVLLYTAGYFLYTAFALPGAIIISLFGGYVFGVVLSLALSVTAATAGASAAFFISRYLLGNYIHDKYARQLTLFNTELSKNGHLYLLTLRFIPVFPFFLINILAGLTNIPFRTFLWTTASGIIPGGFVIMFAGSRLGEINSPEEIFSQKMLLVFVLFGVMMLIPVIYNKIKSRK
ncbi:TVP38/TMEM64 family protein [Seleniivibrio woodruffii]|uniref:TVP38/TMEM64 family protein n=1 Tax=Seleniivibrio woodruffii TaxID=1078050 RepID=UPI0026EA9557|nr:VTT domain-containing protein [Seleniivibrio woodruffii]